jgi:hypothetical protein
MRPRRFRIVVAGELSPRFASAFAGMALECDAGQTVMTGTVVDQAHLHGLLNQVAALGLDLVSVVPIDDDVSGHEQMRGGDAAGVRTG